MAQSSRKTVRLKDSNIIDLCFDESSNDSDFEMLSSSKISRPSQAPSSRTPSALYTSGSEGSLGQQEGREKSLWRFQPQDPSDSAELHREKANIRLRKEKFQKPNAGSTQHTTREQDRPSTVFNATTALLMFKIEILYSTFSGEGSSTSFEPYDAFGASTKIRVKDKLHHLGGGFSTEQHVLRALLRQHNDSVEALSLCDKPGVEYYFIDGWFHGKPSRIGRSFFPDEGTTIEQFITDCYGYNRAKGTNSKVLVQIFIGEREQFREENTLPFRSSPALSSPIKKEPSVKREPFVKKENQIKKKINKKETSAPSEKVVPLEKGGPSGKGRPATPPSQRIAKRGPDFTPEQPRSVPEQPHSLSPARVLYHINKATAAFEAAIRTEEEEGVSEEGGGLDPPAHSTRSRKGKERVTG